MTETAGPFQREPLPERFCNLDRLMDEMRARALDGIVATTPNNVFYLTGFNGIAHKSDEPRPYAAILSRHAPEHAVLIVADYYINTVANQPSWVQDVRSFRAVMMPLDLPPSSDDVERFIPRSAADVSWLSGLRDTFAAGLTGAVQTALTDLGLQDKHVGFDDLRMAAQLDVSGSRLDAYDALMATRAIKTEAELTLLRRATALNEQAILSSIAKFERGMTWREFNHTYHMAAASLGGFVRDPGGMVWGHPRGTDPAITLQSGFEDFVIEPGMHLLFDCHGTLDLYCWDGGKTWVVEDDPAASSKTAFAATAAAVEAIMAGMLPGTTVSQLQAIGRAAFRKAGISDADRAIIFFHGLGLSHMDLAQHDAHGRPNIDWSLEENMVVPVHVLLPGGESERCWVEEVVQVTAHGGEPFFTWGFGPVEV